MRELGSNVADVFLCFGYTPQSFLGHEASIHSRETAGWFPPVLAQIIPLEHTISLEQDRPRQTWAKIMFKMPSGLGSQFQKTSRMFVDTALGWVSWHSTQAPSEPLLHFLH